MAGNSSKKSAKVERKVPAKRVAAQAAKPRAVQAWLGARFERKARGHAGAVCCTCGLAAQREMYMNGVSSNVISIRMKNVPRI